MRDARSYYRSFKHELAEARGYLEESTGVDTSLTERDELFIHAADAYGDALKVAESFQSDFLRGRVEGISATRYEAVRIVMRKAADEVHTMIFERKKLNDLPKLRGKEAA